MNDNIVEDAQKIKKRLSALGENVDETVICELLKSCGPEYELDSIISMITENWETGIQNTLDKAGTSAMCEIQYDIENSKNIVEGTQRISVEDAYVETSDASSDYDDDRDYYLTNNDDDISVVDTVTRSSQSPIELCDNTSPQNHNSEAILPEVEFLEENNNDPNNNLDSVQMLQELQNNSPDTDNKERDQSIDLCMEFIEKGPESPKPGCSKDSHDAFVPDDDSELHTEAKRIIDFLPQFEYDVVSKKLYHNRKYNNAEDRIEITIYDLLRDRLKSKTLFKRKISNDTCIMEHKKSILEKVLLGKIPIVEPTYIDTNQSTVSFMKTRSNKLDRPNNDVNTCDIQSTEKSVVSEIESKKMELQQTKDLVHKAEADDLNQPHNKNCLIRPAKLSKLEQSSNFSQFPSNPILQAPKLIILNKDKIHTLKDKIIKKNIELCTEYRLRELQRMNRLKQKTDELYKTLIANAQTSSPVANRKNMKASNMNIVIPPSSVPSKDLVLPKKLIATETKKLFPNNTLHSSNNNASTSNVFIPKEGNSSESKIKDNLKQEDNTSQGTMPSTSTEKNPNELLLKYLKSSKEDILVPNKPLMSLENKWPKYDFTPKDDKASTSIDLTAAHLQQDMAMIDKKQVDQRDTINHVNVYSNNSVLIEKRKTIYCKLITMFPCIDTKYIKQLCTVNIEDDTPDETVLQNLVEHLLDYRELPKINKTESEPKLNAFDVNEQYANLLDIFPNADPMYLRDIAEQVYNDPDKIKEFVQSKLENPDYPTREQYLAKKKITEQQKQYTTDFKVQKFLEIFPNPFSHFENDKRKCQYKTDALEFLKHHFNKIKVATLLNTFAQYGHNLSLTAKCLESINSDMKSKRCHPLMRTEDIPLLQECAFIQHKAEIKKYLAELKEKEEKEFNDLKSKNELFECQCCFDNECMPSKCSTCEDGHIFCNLCIAKSTDVKLADGETHIQCLSDCGSEFHLSVLQQVLPPTKFSILLQKRQAAEVMAAGLEGLVSCPFCHFASIPPQEDKVFKCFNPECMKESCRLCKEVNHLPLKCNEVKSDAARLYLEEKMTEALVRKCYRCGRTFFKEEGCNKMTCLCGAKMCYICDKPVTDYNHFSGQGTTRTDLCPLWSDDRRMNAEAVIKVCHDTMKQIKEKDPQIDINADALLPKLPPKSKGPHEDIIHANNMPAHINRIARHIP